MLQLALQAAAQGAWHSAQAAGTYGQGHALLAGFAAEIKM